MEKFVVTSQSNFCYKNFPFSKSRKFSALETCYERLPLIYGQHFDIFTLSVCVCVDDVTNSLVRFHGKMTSYTVDAGAVENLN